MDADPQTNAQGTSKRRMPRGTDELPPHKVQLEATRDVVDHLAASVAERIAARGGGGGGGGFGRGSQITISLGVIAASIAFAGLVVTLGAAVWNLSAQIEKKANVSNVQAIERSLARIEQSVSAQALRVEKFVGRDWSVLLQHLENVRKLTQEHEARLRVLEQMPARRRSP